MKTFEQVVNDRPIDSLHEIRRDYRNAVNGLKADALMGLKYKYEGKIVTFDGYNPGNYRQKVVLRKLVTEVRFYRGGDNSYVLGFVLACADGRVHQFNKIYNVEDPNVDESSSASIVIEPKKEKKLVVKKPKEVLEHDPFDEEVDSWNPKPKKNLPHLFLKPKK